MLCLFIIIKNGVYLQECIAAFWGGGESENYTRGTIEVFEIDLLRMDVVCLH